MVAYRTMKTASGATAAQIVHSTGPGGGTSSMSVDAQRGAVGAPWRRHVAAQFAWATQLDLVGSAGTLQWPLPITATRMGHRRDALCRS